MPVSGGAKRVFVAQLAGTSVFDPSGDPVGRVRDVVVVPGDVAPPDDLQAT